MQSTFPPPLHEEFDEQLKYLFVNGDQKGLCAHLPRDKGQLSKELNPEEPAASDFYNFARALWACYATRYELGLSVWAFFENFNAQFRAQAEPLEGVGLAREISGALQKILDPNLPPAEKTRLANRLIEFIESFKIGLGVQTGEGHPAVRPVRSVSR